MRIHVALGQDGTTLTVRAERCSPTVPPARMAAAVAAAVESALQALGPAPLGPATSTRRRSTRRPESRPRSSPPPVSPPPVRPGPVERAPVEPAPAAAAPAAVPAPRAGGAGRDDGEVRARALRLLDDGLSDAQVCAQLGISRGRLLQWDNALAHDTPGHDPLAGTDLVEAGGAR